MNEVAKTNRSWTRLDESDSRSFMARVMPINIGAMREASRWGALLDNLHVADGHHRRGIGSRLLALTAEAILERPHRTGLYLWALEQNVDAQAFYRAHGGRCVERAPAAPPGGIASRLTGSPTKLRYVWAAELLEPR